MINRWSESVTRSSSNVTWTKRFIATAIVQGVIISGITVFLVLDEAYFKSEVSRIMATGGIGTWLTFSYVMYVIIGVLGVAVSSIFFNYLEDLFEKQILGGIRRSLDWLHLVLMKSGTAAMMGLLMYAGYLGGGAILPLAVEGRGLNAGLANQLVAPFVGPMSSATRIIIAGVIAERMDFIATYRLKSLTDALKARMKEDSMT